jgi:hypothetical protein
MKRNPASEGPIFRGCFGKLAGFHFSKRRGEMNQAELKGKLETIIADAKALVDEVAAEAKGRVRDRLVEAVNALEAALAENETQA